MALRSANGCSHTGSTPPIEIAEISPAFAGLQPPLIVIGMHRSGTSMVVGMLQILGVYMDPDLIDTAESNLIPGERARTDGYGEAVAFRLANEAVMIRAGSDWQNVEGFLNKRDGSKFANGCVRELARATGGNLKTGYLDRFPGGEPNAWGWKDPRNSLTLPYWLRLFPGARLLHVRRDTDAIVKSLMRRAVETSVLGVKLPPSTAERIRGAASNPTRIMRGIGRRLGFIPPVRPMTQADWHKLTEQYAGECEKYRHHGPGYLEISYEEILADPLSLTNQISRFASISPDDKAIRNAAAFVSIDRK